MPQQFLTFEHKYLVIFSIFIWLFSMPFQVVLIEALRFQIAHIGQILALLFLLPILGSLKLSAFELKCLMFFIVFLIFALLNSFNNIYGFYLGIFYVVSLLQIFIYIKFISSNNGFDIEVIKKAAYFCRSISFFIFVYFLLEPKFFYSFFMQDKTYFLIYLYTIIFVEVFFYKLQKKEISFFSYIYVLILILLSVTTASRSLAFFLPLCIAILFDALQNKSINKLIKYSVLLSLISFFSYIFYTLSLVTESMGIDDPLYAFDRFLSVLDTNDTSSSSHFLFLKIAVNQKFSDFYNFFFGVGLANFQFAAANSLLFGELSQYEDYMRYAVYSPGFLYMPGVSIWGELFLELPIFLFLPILFYSLKLLYESYVFREYINFLFIFGLFSSGLFYSSHHSSAFYFALFLIILIRYSYNQIKGEIYSNE